MRFFAILLLSFLLLMPVANVDAQGLVTCTGADCDFCDLADMTNGIINWLFGFLTICAVLLFAEAGFRLITSGGDVGAKEYAKNRLTYVIVGFIIMLASWTIIDTVLKALTKDEAGNAQGLEIWGAFDVNNCGGQVKAVSGDIAGLAAPDNLTAIATPIAVSGTIYAEEGPGTTGSGSGVGGGLPKTSATAVNESKMVSLRSAGVVVANWNGINGPGRTDMVHPLVMTKVVWMQNAGLQRFGKTPFQVTAAYTRGVGHSAGSQHYTGLAVDFQPTGNGVKMSQLEQLARDAGFTFVLNEGNHIHADLR